MCQGPAAGSRVRAAAPPSDRNYSVCSRRPASAGWLLLGSLLLRGALLPAAAADGLPRPGAPPTRDTKAPPPSKVPAGLPPSESPVPPPTYAPTAVPGRESTAAPPPIYAPLAGPGREPTAPPPIYAPLAGLGREPQVAPPPVYAPLVGPGQEPTAAAPLTLGALLAEVEAQNPRLQALRAQVRAAGERPAQVATLDDPTLMVELWQVPWDVASVPLMFTLRQPLPWPGKLRARAAVLAPEAARARAEVGVTAAELRLQACRSYYAYWLAVRADQVLRQLRELLGGTVAAVAARYRTGRAELVELLRAQEAVVNLDNQLLDTERERELAVTALNTLRGAEPPTRLGLPVSAPTVRPLPEVTALWARALAQRPELLAVQAAAAQARARGLAAQKERAPDLAVWTSLMKDLRGTQDTFTVGVQASIPSFSLARYGAAGREARAQGQAAQSELQAVQQQIRGEVQQAVLRLLTTGRHLALHSGSLIPLSEQAARAAEAGFQSGRVSLAQLLETARMLSEHHLEYERYLAEYGQRWAELEAATGGPISDGQSPDGGDATGVGGRQ